MSQELDLIVSYGRADEAQVTRFAQALGQCAPKSGRLFLNGPLGGGKTTFARAFLRSRKVTGSIKSPSFSVVEVYDAVVPEIYHFDFYRLNEPHAWLELGLNEYFEDVGIVLVEWATHASGLPPPDIVVTLDFTPDEGFRYLELAAHSLTGNAWLAAANAQP